MIVKEQRGKACPRGYILIVGDVSCEECDDWKFKLTGRLNDQGIECADEYCQKLSQSMGGKSPEVE